MAVAPWLGSGGAEYLFRAKGFFGRATRSASRTPPPGDRKTAYKGWRSLDKTANDVTMLVEETIVNGGG